MVVVRLAVVACAISLGLTLGPAHAQEAVKVGVIGPFTGPSASSGIAMRKSFELAQEEFNSQGGRSSTVAARPSSFSSRIRSPSLKSASAPLRSCLRGTTSR
jgi:hypothetical protein